MKKFGILASVVAIVAVSVMTVASAVTESKDEIKPVDRYDELSARNIGYKERAEKIGQVDVEDIEILYTSNYKKVKTNEINILSLEDMEGYNATLNDGAYYLSNETMTYGELLESDEAIDLDPTIAKDRVVWVTKAYYPNNIEISGGYIETAQETKYWDAETGDFIGATIRSLNPDGSTNPNGIHMERPTVIPYEDK